MRAENTLVGCAHVLVFAFQIDVVQVKTVGIFHQEFASAHHPETRTDFIAEFGLDLVQVYRQLAITVDVATDQIGDHFFMRRAEHEVALMAILQAQQLRAVFVVASGFLPKLGRHDHRSQHFLRAGAIHFLAYDGFNFAQDAQTQWQPCVDSCRKLADHACTQHQPVTGDFGVCRNFFERDEVKIGQTHVRVARREKRTWIVAVVPRAAKYVGRRFAMLGNSCRAAQRLPWSIAMRRFAVAPRWARR